MGQMEESLSSLGKFLIPVVWHTEAELISWEYLRIIDEYHVDLLFIYQIYVPTHLTKKWLWAVYKQG